jgi:alpha-glucosidase
LCATGTRPEKEPIDVTLHRTAATQRPTSSGPSGDAASSAPRISRPWWRDAVTYQVYVRSFADGNGDGIGDLRASATGSAYLAELGVDAIWLNPWFPSPMADAGYDVADYRDIDPDFGTLAEMPTR